MTMEEFIAEKVEEMEELINFRGAIDPDNAIEVLKKAIADAWVHGDYNKS